MANLKDATRRTLAVAMGDKAAAADVASAIDAHLAGTLSSRLVRKLSTLFGDRQEAGRFVAAVNAPSALTGRTQLALGVALANEEAAADIADRLAGV